MLKDLTESKIETSLLGAFRGAPTLFTINFLCVIYMACELIYIILQNKGDISDSEAVMIPLLMVVMCVNSFLVGLYAHERAYNKLIDTAVMKIRKVEQENKQENINIRLKMLADFTDICLSCEFNPKRLEDQKEKILTC